MTRVITVANYFYINVFLNLLLLTFSTVQRRPSSLPPSILKPQSWPLDLSRVISTSWRVMSDWPPLNSRPGEECDENQKFSTGISVWTAINKVRSVESEEFSRVHLSLLRNVQSAGKCQELKLKDHFSGIPSSQLNEVKFDQSHPRDRVPEPPDVINLSKSPINSILFFSNDIMRKLKNMTVSRENYIINIHR